MKPSVCYVTEAQVLPNSNQSNFNLTGYTLLSMFFAHVELALNIRENVGYKPLLLFGQCLNPELIFMWIKFVADSQSIFKFFIYRSYTLALSPNFNEFDAFSDSISKI